MATTAPATTKTPAAPKTMATPRKRAAGPVRGGPPLQLRYYTVMKPQRVYALVVEVPARKGGEVKGGGTVVVRPIIPGALVMPAEQRFDTSAAGNQITFHVTPLARGRLPRARVEVFVPGQPPQEIPLSLSAHTQRLSWLLLLLAFVVPWLMVKVTTGDWKPPVTHVNGRLVDSAVALRGQVWTSLHSDVVPIPLFNKPAGRDLTKDELEKKKCDSFTLAGSIADFIGVGYKGLEEGVRANRWALAAGVILALLAFVSWSFHRARTVRVRKRLELAPAEAAGEPPVLQPL